MRIKGFLVVLCLTTGIACVLLPSYGMADPVVIQQKLQAIPDNSDDALVVFAKDGSVIRGDDALDLMQSNKTDLNIWLGGRHFFGIKAVIRAWQKRYGGTVGLITLPSKRIAGGIVDGGWIYRGRSFSMRPDVFGMIGTREIRKLKDAGLATVNVTYAHNELALIVAKGNPKHIHQIEDLARPNLHIMLPNPVDERIMKVYARKMLERFHLWKRLSGGKDCAACQAGHGVYFTSAHDLEIPEGVRNGRADVGLLWLTECQNALGHRFNVSVVRLPPAQSLRGELSYIAAEGSAIRHPAAARQFLKFLGSQEAQSILTRHGYIGADKWELKIRKIK
ncbi:MAG: substrate-binding domain-containing protein [Pseudomonadota bacterium]|nr:substrate-binding domain-containing protein [Pseudomonadota bacterium]